MIDGKMYEHDVVVRLSGEVVKRKKKLSKKLYGTSHLLSKDEAKFLFEKGCDQVVIGSGQMGNVHLSAEAEAYFERKRCEVVLMPTPEAIRLFNRSRAKRIGPSRDLRNALVKLCTHVDMAAFKHNFSDLYPRCRRCF